MSDRPKVLQIGRLLDFMDGRLAEGFEVVHLPESGPADFLAQHGAGIEAIVTTKGVAPEVMAGLPDLKVISSFGVGYDGIDAEAAAKRGILVSNTPDVLNDEVADTAILLWLMVSRRAVPAERWARSGDWEAKGAFPLTRSVRGRTVGIVGLGRIGTTIAEQVGMFDAEVVYHSRSEKDVPYRYYPDLVEMARDADVLIVITPGGDETKHLIGREVLEALGPEGTLINVARGSVVDEAALVAALQEGKLGAAGLDVFEEEPRIPEALKAMDNVVLLPHVGSATVETRAAMGNLVCDNLDEWRATGRVRTPVAECKFLND